MARKVIRELREEKFKKVKEIKKKEESLEDIKDSQDVKEFDNFFSSSGETAPSLKPSDRAQQAQTPVLEDTAGNAPSEKKEKEQVTYAGAVNAPEYGNVYEQISQRVENRRTDSQVDITRAQRMSMEPRFTSEQEINFANWQRENLERKDSSNDYQIGKIRKRKRDDEPFD
ncbi:MAG: hypothetical protein ABIH72_01705 [archaeon]